MCFCSQPNRSGYKVNLALNPDDPLGLSSNTAANFVLGGSPGNVLFTQVSGGDLDNGIQVSEHQSVVGSKCILNCINDISRQAYKPMT